MPAGRPTDYSEELVASICARISSGESLRSICRDPEMPSAASVFLWLSKYKQFSEQYAKATEERAEALFDEMFEIADDSQNDTYVDENGNTRTNSEVVARSRLRVDVRKWALSKMIPKKYGDKIQAEHTGADGGPIQNSLSISFVAATKDGD